MPVKKLKKFLDDNHIEYVTIQHSQAFTSPRIAASAHISGKELAKTVMVKVDGEMAMAVLPSNFQVDFDQLKKTTKAENVELAGEEEFKYLFPECELGAMPPFGNLWNMDVYVAETLAEDEMICFNAGSHTELIQLSYKDFIRLVKPSIIKFSSQVI
jgi:Ala-tRNA(Pro) deacylase